MKSRIESHKERKENMMKKIEEHKNKKRAMKQMEEQVKNDQPIDEETKTPDLEISKVNENLYRISPQNDDYNLLAKPKF